MKHFFGLIVMMLLAVESVCAQQAGKPLNFYYIAHSGETPVNTLCRSLKENAKNARNFNQPSIFYLANVDEPYMVYIDGKSTNEDMDKFEEIIGELQEKRFHELNIVFDVENLINLFNRYDFLDDSGNYKVSSMVWEFFVDQNFWDLTYNERLISKLFYSLELGDAPEGFFRLKVNFSGEKDFEYDPKYPFGVKNFTPELSNFDKLKL